MRKDNENMDSEEIELLKQKIQELKGQNRDLQEQLSQGEVRSEKVLCLFTKSNVERLKEMAEFSSTSRNDMLNRLVEAAYFSESYKNECAGGHMGKGYGRGRKAGFKKNSHCPD